MQPIEWRPVRGYEGYYEVSEQGYVRSVPRTVTTRSGVRLPLKGVTLRGGIDACGYRRYVLTRENRARTHKAHRLVAFAFLGDPAQPDLDVCHNDGNPINNDWRNLRWDTRLANMQDRDRHGRTFRGRRPRAIPESDLESVLERRRGGERFADIGRTYGVGATSVRRMVEESGEVALLNRVACDNGHPWIEENIMFVRAGVKRCRICNRADELRKLAPKRCIQCGDSFASLRMHMRRMHPTTSKEG